MGDLKLYAIAGSPVLHSKSPQMFHAAFEALGINSSYYLRFAASRPEEVLRVMRGLPVSGFNITSPFKEEIIPLLDDVDETARKIGAVNAIINEGGKLKGFNTDYRGVEGAFRENGIKLTGKKAIVVGAGGAARAAVAALVPAGADVIIINRTLKKARLIAETFFCKASPIEDLEEKMEEADILVSCLPVGKHIVPTHSLRQGLIILDANYGEGIGLIDEGKRCGCKIVDGREWLLYQGLAAFTLFTGEKVPPVEVMRKGIYGQHTAGRKNIVLIGFMGTGKSVVGRHVAERLKLRFIDVDAEIEKNNNTTVETIFESEGEEAFRKMEAEEIERIDALHGGVIACGGGAVLNESVMDRLGERSIMVWLWADVDTILKRTQNSGARPLLKVKDRRSEIEKILSIRKSYYTAASDLFIDTSDKKPEEIAERICYESDKFLTD